MKLSPRTTAFLFPGQGSQAVGMGHDLADRFASARRVFEESDRLLGMEFSKIMWEGPESELNDTVNTQPALYIHSQAAFQAFTEAFGDFYPSVMAGHSLGELSALTAAGSLDFARGLRLVRRRGELMKQAGETSPGSMAAILNLGIPELEKVCIAASIEHETVQVANDNCPGQVVISGAKPAVQRAMDAAKAAGAKRALPLAVSIAAHSRLMASIQDEWNDAVAAAGIQDARVPVVGNAAARMLSSATELCADIKAQMQSRVRWTETVQLLMQQGISSFVEVGTGNVLLGLVRRTAPAVEGYPLGNPADYAALE